MTQEPEPSSEASVQSELSKKASLLLFRFGKPFFNPLLLEHGVMTMPGTATKALAIGYKKEGKKVGSLFLLQQFDGRRNLVIQVDGTHHESLYSFDDKSVESSMEQQPVEVLYLLGKMDQALSVDEKNDKPSTYEIIKV